MLSVESIRRQVEREGKRWGLVPVVRDGKVFVAEMSAVVDAPHRGVGSVDYEPRLICSVDEDHPFAAVLMARVQRSEWDLMDRYNRRRQAEKEASQKELEAILHTARSTAVRRYRKKRQVFAMPGLGR